MLAPLARSEILLLLRLLRLWPILARFFARRRARRSADAGIDASRLPRIVAAVPHTALVADLRLHSLDFDPWQLGRVDRERHARDESHRAYQFPHCRSPCSYDSRRS